jgi:DMSO/TMAO reductase YedYZ molybdopterin-dependent catalytic subunit
MNARRAATCGALAAAAGLIAAEVVAAVIPGVPSLVLGIADRVIESTPDSLRESLIALVGTLDKLLLSIGIVVAVIGGGALVGVLRRRHPRSSVPVVAMVGVLGGLLASSVASVPVTMAVALLAVGVTCAVLGALMPVGLGSVSPDSPGDIDPEGHSMSPLLAAEPTRPLSRRELLKRSTVVTVLAVGGLGVIAVARRGATATVDQVRATLKLPAVQDKAPSVPIGATPAVEGLAPVVTPASDFFLIDTSLIKPNVDVDSWSLSIGGRVNAPYSLTYEQLRAMPQTSRYVTLTCVSNEVGGDLVGNALWQGVLLRDLIERAKPSSAGVMVTSESVDGFTTAFPLAMLTPETDALVAIGMNGEPLPVNHGFPARIVVPGLYGYVSATKWLKEIRLTAVDDEVPFWIARGWSAAGDIAIASRIDVPHAEAEVSAGRVTLAGRAWQPRVGVAGVEISVDQQEWRPAKLADALGIDAWRLWSFDWDATSGEHQVRVRARSRDGVMQDEVNRPIFPGASSGLHTITVRVA